MLRIREAGRSDNVGLLSLTLMTPMAGEISIRTDRFPDFFRLVNRRGRSRVLVAEADGEIVGCVSASAQTVRVNGEPELVHYLGDLKVRPDHQSTGLAVRLLKALRDELEAERADLIVSTAAYGNAKVLPFFDGRAGLPRAAALGTFKVHQILPSLRGPDPSGYSIREEAEQPEFYRLYNDHLRHYQFGPVLEEGSLRAARHWVARSDGEIRAAISVVDVGDAKQNVLIRLPVVLGGLVSLIRSLNRVVPIASLPRVNEPIPMLYIKSFGCRAGHAAALDLLIQECRNVCRHLNYSFLAAGIHERDPFGGRFRRLPKFTFKSLGFVLGLKRGYDELLGLAKRVPYEDYSLI